jgi:ABC-type Zn uptake system ZnuABC Zn-binding protein ZnuA
VRLAIGLSGALLALVLLLWATGPRETSPRHGQPTAGLPVAHELTVVATVFPLADWLREVGGPQVRVHLLVNAQSDPHHYEPTIKDALALVHARALFAVGLELDPWARRLAENAAKGDSLKFFTTGEWITPRRFPSMAHEELRGSAGIADPLRQNDSAANADEHGIAGLRRAEAASAAQAGAYDPHFWLDPERARIVVRRLAEELGQLDPAHAAGYTQRAAAYEAQLDKLNESIRAAAAALPRGQRIVTFHDAYGYLLDRLGVTVAAVVQVSPGIEPSPRDVAAAVRMMRRLGQRTVYEEPAGSQRAAEIVAQELGGSVAWLDPLDTELSPTGKTYVARLRYDIETLVKTLRAY